MTQKCFYNPLPFGRNLEGCQQLCTLVIRLPRCCKGYFLPHCQGENTPSPCHSKGARAGCAFEGAQVLRRVRKGHPHTSQAHPSPAISIVCVLLGSYCTSTLMIKTRLQHSPGIPAGQEPEAGDHKSRASLNNRVHARTARATYTLSQNKKAAWEAGP